MPHILDSSIAGLVVAGALGAFVSPPPPTTLETDSTQAATRTVHVSAFDKDGMSVADLQAADIELKVGGKTLGIVGVREAKTPLRVSILVADQGTGAFQQSIGRFMQTLLGHAEFALTSVIVQPQQIVDYSGEGRVLSEGLSRLGQRGRERGAQLLEAIKEATKTVRHEARRPVILVLRLGAEGLTDLRGKDVLDDLRKSGAVLYVVSSAGAQASAPSQARGTDAVAQQTGQLRDDELNESAQNLATVLGDGSKESGGRHDQVVATTHSQTVQRIATELRHQYEITFEAPDTLKPGDKLSVSAKRKGVTLRGPSRLTP